MPTSHIKGYDRKQLLSIADKLILIEDWLNQQMHERTDTIRQIILALVMQQHVLVTGGTGTGKSRMANLVFDSVDGERNFEIGLNKFTTDSAVFGPVNAKLLREQGIMVHNTEGSIVQAHLVYLDEFLDASTPLLRSLLAVLNERKFIKGQQIEEAALMSAIATTNGDPYAEMKRKPELQAVVDRFLFKARVDSLRERPSRMAMVKNFVNGGAKPKVLITLEELQIIASVVKDKNLILDEYILELYLTILEKWGAKALQVTDRATNLMTEALEAHALLDGRIVVGIEDLYVLRYVLPESGNKEHLQIWDGIAKEVIVAEQDKIASSVDDLANQLITKLSSELPRLNLNPTPEQLKEAASEIVRIRSEVESIRPQSHVVRTKRTQLLSELSKMEARVTSAMFS